MHEDTDGGENAPLLELDLRVVRARLSPDELLEVANRVVWTALHAYCMAGLEPAQSRSTLRSSAPLRPRRSLAMTYDTATP